MTEKLILMYENTPIFFSFFETFRGAVTPPPRGAAPVNMKLYGMIKVYSSGSTVIMHYAL